MVDMALETVRSGGHVLIPVDTAGRVLELLLRLDEKWDDRFPLVFVNAVGSSTVRLAVRSAHPNPCSPLPWRSLCLLALLVPVQQRLPLSGGVPLWCVFVCPHSSSSPGPKWSG